MRAHDRRALLDAVPDMLFRLDREGRYLEFKPGLGVEPYVPPDEFMGRRMVDVLPAKVAVELTRLVERVLDSGEPATMIYQLTKDGAAHDYEGRVVPLGAEEVLAVVRDITGTGPPSAERDLAAEMYGLSKREHTVLRLVAVGLTDKEIGLRLDISAMTVSKHLGSIRKKMGAQSRTEASVRAVKEGLLD